MLRIKHSKSIYYFYYFAIFCCATILLSNSDATPSVQRKNVRSLIFDGEWCPRGWTTAGGGGVCVQLRFEPRRVADAQSECRKLGAELVRLTLDQNFGAQTILVELSHLINEAISKGVPEYTWMIGRVENLFEVNQQKHERVRRNNSYFRGRLEARLLDRFRVVKRSGHKHVHFALRKKENDADIFEIVELNSHSVLPFICALLSFKRKALLYEQALLPKGAPQIMDEPSRRTSYYHFSVSQPWLKVSKGEEDKTGTNSYFVRLPCRVVGTPQPHVRWYRTDRSEEIDVNASNSRYLISGGALYINTSESSNAVTSYYCIATNKYGTVRSATALVRPIFVEPFHTTRVDVFPLGAGVGRQQRVGANGIAGTGTRIECDAPRHYPKSYAFSWAFGSSNEQFLSVSERIFISMDGTLYFAYNVAEDAKRYSCILALPVTQSAQHGPFFRLQLPQFQGTALSTVGMRQQPFAPRIDEYQPNIFPEFPLRGETVFIECFAYGFPIPSYKWSRADGMPMSGRHHITNYGRVLKIDAVELNDAVRYKCAAKNEVGTTSAEVQLIVQMPPMLLRPMADIMVAHNETAFFHCNVQDGGGVGMGKVRYTVEWFHNGQPLTPLLMSRADRKRVNIVKKELWIHAVADKDVGVYQCLVSNDVGTASSTALLVVKTLSPIFYANVFPSKIFVVEGTKIQIPCFYLASPRGQSYWRRLEMDTDIVHQSADVDANFHIEIPSTLKDDIDAVAVLRLNSVTKADQGVYECVASNVQGTASARVYLNVLPPAKVRVSLGNDSANGSTDGGLEVSCEVELDCAAGGECPEALFDWKFNDKTFRNLPSSENHDAPRISQSELSINENLPIDKNELGRSTEPGVYSGDSLASKLASKMNAMFEFGKKKDKNEPDVVIIDTLSENAFARERDDGFFYSPNGVSIAKHLKAPARLYRSSVRLVSSFVARNVGRFSCMSTFGVGAVAELTPPFLLGAVATNLRAELLDDDFKESIDENFDEWGLSEFGEFTASLSWRQPSGNFLNDDAQKIIGYEVEFRTAKNRAWKNARFVASSNTTVLQSTLLHALEPNQRYQFRLRTRGLMSDALSIPSPPSNWLKTDKCAPQESVSEIRHKVFDNTHVLLEWDPIEMDYSTGDYLRYNVSWSRLLFGKNVDEFGSFETVEDTNLLLTVPAINEHDTDDNDGCMRLVVSVRPYNDAGVGRFSTDTILHLTHQQPKRRAQNARLSCLNATHLTLTWEWTNTGECENVLGTQISCDEVRAVPIETVAASSKNSGNSQYKNVYDVVAVSVINQSVPSYYNSWMLHSLRPSTSYRCRLTPFDQYGRMGPSAASTVASTKSPAPQISPEITYIRFNKVSNGNFSILLDWNSIPLELPHATNNEKEKRHSDDDNDDDDADAGDSGYKIFLYITETAQIPVVLTLSSAQLFDRVKPSARIDGLRSMYSYSIQIAGFNAGGLGPLSEAMPIRIGTTHFDTPISAGNSLRRCFSHTLLLVVVLFVLQTFQNFFSTAAMGLR